jgi:hypothetical protein
MVFWILIESCNFPGANNSQYSSSVPICLDICEPCRISHVQYGHVKKIQLPCHRTEKKEAEREPLTEHAIAIAPHTYSQITYESHMNISWNRSVTLLWLQPASGHCADFSSSTFFFILCFHVEWMSYFGVLDHFIK